MIEDLINNKVRPQFTARSISRNSLIAETIDLSNILLKPILEKIGNKRLAIIGDGVLRYIPFAALPDPRVGDRYQPLLVNHEVVYLPSASTLQTLRNEAQARTPAPKTLAVLGDWDRLPGTRREANTILNLVPESNRLAYFDFPGDRANALNNQLSEYRFIHWAIQGFINTENPELSSMVACLVDRNGARSNRNLLFTDIFNLSFNADLVVLSACQTPLEGVGLEEGSIGLIRGVMYAGTPRVVTNLWDVPDTETATLMGKFYEKMLQQNLRPAEALRAAQLEMFNSRSWSPFYWAAFTLQGEWR
ncbi:MAG: CHAT domain-containing protein [Coleofasciculaceae cyanobacterium SM2_1_6]|nr:CHAT domain-containing protein [Coleofasciculaceae cyanobacterium SM2_1_6]